MTLAVHNITHLGDDEVTSRFVVRHHELDELVAHLTEDDPPRHALVIGQRGMGKSLLLRRLAISVAENDDLAKRWLPLVLREELYQATSVGDLWMSALHQLAVSLGDADLTAQHQALQAERDPARLETLALQRLLAAARSRGQRLLLLAENLDMLLDDQMGATEGWSLRQALQTENNLLLVATAVTTFAAVEEAGEAFYGFFHRIDLHPLDDASARLLWQKLTGADLAGDRIVPVRILTGGNPRLLTVMARFSTSPDLRDLRHDLELLIDEYTAYFKANIEALPVVERKVYVTLADIWAPATAAEVAERTRMTSSQVSVHLGRLVRRGAVQAVEHDEGRQRYELSERLYNLYLLMRTPDGSGRVRALVDILVHLFTPAGLERSVLPGLVQRPPGLAPDRMNVLVASRLEQHIDDAGVWERMASRDIEARLPMLQALVSSQLAELGDDHPDTLLTRANLALATGRAGDRRRALGDYRRLLADCERILGPDHSHTLEIRHGVAFNTGQTGHPLTALNLYRKLVPDRERTLGPDHPDTLNTRYEVAYYTGATGDPHTALDLYRKLLTDSERSLRPDHPDTLDTRHQVAYYTGATGDFHTALDLYRKLLTDSERSLGPDHADTFIARRQVEYYSLLGRTASSLPRELRDVVWARRRKDG